MDFMFALFPFIFLGMIGVSIFSWIHLKEKDRQSLDKYIPLPVTEQAMDPNVCHALKTLRTRDKDHCIHCGRLLDKTARYCAGCGREQGIQQSVTFSDGNNRRVIVLMPNNDRILYSASKWLADNPYVWNVKMTVDKGIGIGMHTHSTALHSLTLSYEVRDRKNPYQYAVLQIEKHNGYMMIDANKLVSLWSVRNPHGKVVTWTGQTNSRGQNGNVGYGACHTCQIFLLAAFPRNMSVLLQNNYYTIQ